MTSSSQLLKTARSPGGEQSVLVCRRASPCPASPLLFPSMTGTDTRCCRPTWSRLSGITLGPTPMNSWPNQGSLSTLTGLAMVAACRPPLTMPSHIHRVTHHNSIDGTFHLPHNTAYTALCPTFCYLLRSFKTKCRKRLLKSHPVLTCEVVPWDPSALASRDCPGTDRVRQRDPAPDAVTFHVSHVPWIRKAV